MKLQLVSQDPSLLALCREVTAERTDHLWELELLRNYQADFKADLCLWDYRNGLLLPPGLSWATEHFVLVDYRDVAAFRSAHPYAESSIILKPVGRAVLRGLIAQAIDAGTLREKSTNGSTKDDRDDILQCLIESNLRLQQLDQERTNFLSRAIHDFHAPLTAFSGYCGLLLEGQLGAIDKQQATVLERMHHSARRLSRMTQAMFQLSVGRHINLKPILRPGELIACVEQALYELSHLLSEKQIQVDFDVEPSPVPLWFEAEQMEQVLVNLLENACKFTPRLGSIAIRGYPCFQERRAPNILCSPQQDRRQKQDRSPNSYRIDIQDSGPGIAPEHVMSIFEEYVSYSGGQDRSGGGLGLAICRMILGQHGGRIWVENSSPGATFSFILPFLGEFASEAASEMRNHLPARLSA